LQVAVPVAVPVAMTAQVVVAQVDWYILLPSLQQVEFIQ